MSISNPKTEKKSFWPNAKIYKSLGRYDPGTKKHQHKIEGVFGKGSFRRLRRYKGPGGETRITYEVYLNA